MNARAGWVVLAALIVLPAASGCGGRLQQGTGILGFRKKPIQGTVSLPVLARANPDWLLVDKTDQAIARYQSMLDMPGLTQKPGSMPGSLLPPVPANSLPEISTNQTVQQQRLAGLGGREITRLKTSLETAKAERLAAEQKIAQAQAEQEYLGARQEILNRLLDLQRAILAGDQEQVLNLTIQIKAIRANMAGPQTAPDDHWEKLAADKEAQLAKLTGDQQSQLGIAQQATDAELRSLESRLNGQVAEQVAQMQASIDRENDAQVHDQEARLATQRAQILAMTKTLQGELAQSMASLKTARPGAGVSGQATLNADAASTQSFMAESMPAWRARLTLTVTALTRQRDRQAQLVMEETRRAVLEVAREKRLRITGWQGAGSGSGDLTKVVLAALQKERWGQA